MALQAPAGPTSALIDYGLYIDMSKAYHKINAVAIPSPGDSFRVEMFVYANELARRDYKNPVGTRVIFLSPFVFQENDTLYSAIYRALKEQVVDYAQAIDC